MTSTTKSLKRRIKAIPGYQLVHVARRAGLGHLWRRETIVRQIDRCPAVSTQRWSPSVAGQGGDDRPAEVHMLVRACDVRMAIWTLQSFYRYAQVDWPIVIHQGGPMQRSSWRRLRRQLPQAYLLRTSEADELMQPELERRGMKHAAAVRSRAPMLRKLLDPLVLSSATSLLVVDSDVLFFRRPDEILAAAGQPDHPNLFNREQDGNAYNVSPDEAREQLGATLVNGLNAGLSLLRRESLSLDRIEALLAQPIVTRAPFFVEQTLHGLLAGETNHQLLPDTYACTTRPGLQTADGQPVAAKHYIETPRPLLFEEGMAELVRRGLTNGSGV